MRVFLAMLMSLIVLHAGEIRWHDNYEAAKTLAESQNKRLFVFMSTQDCQWCKKLEATTFIHPDIVARVDKDYVAVHLDRDHDAYPKTINAQVVPMCFFLTSSGEMIDFTRGYWDDVDFNLILNDVDKRLKKMNL